jgi:hypothetical protein
MESKQKDPFEAVLKGVANLLEPFEISRFYVLVDLNGRQENGMAADQLVICRHGKIYKCILPDGRFT